MVSLSAPSVFEDGMVERFTKTLFILINFLLVSHSLHAEQAGYEHFLQNYREHIENGLSDGDEEPGLAPEWQPSPIVAVPQPKPAEEVSIKAPPPRPVESRRVQAAAAGDLSDVYQMVHQAIREASMERGKLEQTGSAPNSRWQDDLERLSKQIGNR